MQWHQPSSVDTQQLVESINAALTKRLADQTAPPLDTSHAHTNGHATTDSRADPLSACLHPAAVLNIDEAAVIDLFSVYDESVAQPTTAKQSSQNATTNGTHATSSSKPSAHASSTYTYQWLLQQSTTYRTTANPLSVTELAAQILTLVKNQSTDDVLANDLLSLLGEAAFDFIGELVTHRNAVRHIQPATANGTDGTHLSNTITPSTRHMRNLVGVTIKHESQIQAAKQQSKQDRKMAKMSVAPDEQKEHSSKPVINEARLDAQATALRDWINASGANSLLASALPANATREQKKGYELVTVPPPTPKPIAEGELIQVDEAFPAWAQLAFKGIRQLNRIQSKVYKAAFHHNNNLLICAPTGAGKTNIAMMAVLHEIGRHINNHGVLSKKDFKVVYVAPMKALAQEVQATFQRRLAPLGLQVKEVTGDTQLSRQEVHETQMLVTTPEKWDVMTRKAGDDSLTDQVRLLIIDEVHILHDDRGPVIETIVSRTLRRIEATQQMCRVVGLSATLPNYTDVAVFLGVNLQTGLFHFGPEYRPVPLLQQYIGIQQDGKDGKKMLQYQKLQTYNQIAYEKVIDSVKRGHQVMVFVHSRRDTVKTARAIRELAAQNGTIDEFNYKEHPQYTLAMKKLQATTRNSELQDLFATGFACHHAGMPRKDRAFVEQHFVANMIGVLVCTATLAWGVNLPAHTVIIKGTQLYDAARGGWVDLGMQDTMQIFGRAGRPGFDTSGEGILITDAAKLPTYLSLLSAAMPIESQFIKQLPDHLNAEIILGTVSNVREAASWLSYTYLYTRMLKNPMRYAVGYEQLANDPTLAMHRRELILSAIKTLIRCRMIRYDAKSETFYSTDVGRVASHYYITHPSMEIYNNRLTVNMDDSAILDLIAGSSEFEHVKVRDEEQSEIERVAKMYCPVKINGDLLSPTAKCNLLLQTHISRGDLMGSPTLASDSHYITQSAGRITRALFELVLKRNKAHLASRLLAFTIMVERQCWEFQTPLRQFSDIKQSVLTRVEDTELTVEDLQSMTAEEIGVKTRHNTATGQQILKHLNYLPYIEVHATAQPITRAVLRVTVNLTPNFVWSDKQHGMMQSFYIWIVDRTGLQIVHSEQYNLHREDANEAMSKDGRQLFITATIPVTDPPPTHYTLQCYSERFLGSYSEARLDLSNLRLPESTTSTTTQLLELHPLPVSALHWSAAEQLYSFKHFNPIQTQIFHTLYHTDENVLLGAPTGSGKTIVAEIAMLRLWRNAMSSNNSKAKQLSQRKVIYIAPLKALARERLNDWRRSDSLAGLLGIKVIELTGDTSQEAETIRQADVIITTPEKFDVISRDWQHRRYVRQVGLVVVDEVHMLGADRGHVLEAIVSRLRCVATSTLQSIRLVALSTALANAGDLADWLGVDRNVGLYNFPPAVRPCPLSLHIAGFSGRHYCPRMQAMNRPAYAAILQHSPSKPALIFVSSRRQTRLTALDLIAYTAADGNPRKWLKMSEDELAIEQAGVRDANIRHMLAFGVGIHHAGLNERDRSTVERLFEQQRIQVLVATSTLVWGVNLPAHLVVVKGTEYFDGRTHRYIDYPITDVLQMTGRAGRPKYDQEGVAVVLVQDVKKPFYLNFLHSPFPVESSLLGNIQATSDDGYSSIGKSNGTAVTDDKLADHIAAECVNGTIRSLRDALEYLSWTFLFRRLLVNPSYYACKSSEPEDIKQYLVQHIMSAFTQLSTAGLIQLQGKHEALTVEPLFLGRIASFYYIKYNTIALYAQHLHAHSSLDEILPLLCLSSEYNEVPVRMTEDQLNAAMASACRLALELPADDEHRRKRIDYGDPHVKANILLQYHIGQLEDALPIVDYKTDTKLVLDNAPRLLQAMLDLTAEAGWLTPTHNAIKLLQMVSCSRWHDQSAFSLLPHMTPKAITKLQNTHHISSLGELCQLPANRVDEVLKSCQLSGQQFGDVQQRLSQIPALQVEAHILKSADAQSEALKLRVTIRRDNVSTSGSTGKRQPAAFCLLVTLKQQKQLLQLKRVTCNSKVQTIEVMLNKSELSSECMSDLSVQLVSQAFIGLEYEAMAAP